MRYLKYRKPRFLDMANIVIIIEMQGKKTMDNATAQLFYKEFDKHFKWLQPAQVLLTWHFNF